MKKGLISVLGTILLAMAGSGFANAPIVSGIPDVVIGDAGDQIGATADANFFRYADAFNILEYYEDADASSVPALMKFAFDEVGTGTPAVGGDFNNISINDKTQVTNPLDPTTWDAIQGTYLFSFRDILRSPGTGTPTSAFPAPFMADGTTLAGDGDLLPWSTTALTTLGGDARQVTILVADETDNVGNDTINVYSQNNVADKLSGTFTTVFSDAVFASSDWTYQTFAGYSVATSGGGTGNGFIGLAGGPTAAAGNTYVGRWNQAGVGAGDYGYLDNPIDQIADGLIYRAKLTLQLESAASSRKALAPTIRFGVENSLQILVITNIINSRSFAEPDGAAINSYIPDVGTSLNYNMYWNPGANLPGVAGLADYAVNAGGTGIIDLDGWHVFFDVVDSDNTDSGEWRMTYVEVNTLERPATDPTAVPVTNFTVGTTVAYSNPGWTAAQTNGSATVTPSATSVVFNAPIPGATVNWAQFTRRYVATWESGKVMRYSVMLSTPTDLARENLHSIRLRSGLDSAMIAQEYQIRRISSNPGNEEALMPAVLTQTPYETYVTMYGGPAAIVTTAELDKFDIGLDEIPAGDPASTAATSWTCHQVLIEVLDDPIP